MKNINRTFNPIERFFESKFELWKQQQIQRREPPLKFKKVKRDQESYKKIKKVGDTDPCLLACLLACVKARCIL